MLLSQCFHKAGQNSSGYSRRCKSCDKDYQRDYRAGNKEKISRKTKEKREQYKLMAIDRLGQHCSRCGGLFDSCVYDFHHKDPTKKSFTVSERMSIKLEDFLLEVDKCVLLCANCHRMEHKNEQI